MRYTILKRLVALMALLSGFPLWGAALIVDRDSTVYEGGAYDRVGVNGRKYVTLRNVTVQNNVGTNDYAGIRVNNSSNVNIDKCEVNGMARGGKGTCGGIKVDNSSYVTIRSTKIHNCNDDGIRIWYLDIYDCEIYHLVGCGTDDGCSQCNNGHSDGIEIGGVDTVEFSNCCAAAAPAQHLPPIASTF